MTIRSISAIVGIFVFVRCVSITMIVRSKMSNPILIVGSLQTHAVIINIDRGGVFSLYWYNGFRVAESI